MLKLSYTVSEYTVFKRGLVVSRSTSSTSRVPSVDGLDVLVVLLVLFLKVEKQLAQPGSAPELVLGVERIRPGLTGGDSGVSVVRRRRRHRIVLVQSAVHRPCWWRRSTVHPENVASVAL